MSEYQNQQNDLNDTFQTALEALQEKDNEIAELTLTLSEYKQVMQEQAQTITLQKQRIQEITEATVKRNESDNELKRSEELKQSAEQESKQNEKQKNELNEQEKRLNTQQAHLSEIEEKNKQDKADIDRKRKNYNKRFENDHKKRMNEVLCVGSMFAHAHILQMIACCFAVFLISDHCRSDLMSVGNMLYSFAEWIIAQFGSNWLYFVLGIVIFLLVFFGLICGIGTLFNKIKWSVREEMIKNAYVIIITTAVVVRTFTDVHGAFVTTAAVIVLGITTFILLSGDEKNNRKTVKQTLQEIYNREW